MWLLVRVVGVVAALRVLLPCVPLRTLMRWLGRTAGRRRAVCMETTARFAEALIGRMRFPTPGPCLPRSLALYYFARSGGLPVQLHCGVLRAGGRLQGHAWLTLNGEPFLENGDPGSRYAITFSYPDG